MGTSVCHIRKVGENQCRGKMKEVVLGSLFSRCLFGII